MDASIPNDAGPGGLSSRKALRLTGRKALLLTGILLIVVMFIINDLLRLLNGGGIFSVVLAIDSVQSRQRFVDVDSAGLRILFLVACSLTGTALAMVLNADINRRLNSFIFMVSIVGGGFILDRVYGPAISKGYMADHGYTRCSDLDQVRGSGKFRVRTDDYVLKSADCPTESPET
jgi:hypothetical protein